MADPVHTVLQAQDDLNQATAAANAQFFEDLASAMAAQNWGDVQTAVNDRVTAQSDLASKTTAVHQAVQQL